VGFAQTGERWAEMRIRVLGRSVRGLRGFSIFELLVVLYVVGLLVVFAGPVAAKWTRRAEGVAAFTTARQVLAVARLEAIKRSANIDVRISRSPDDRIRLETVQESPFATLGDVSLSPRIHLWKYGGSRDDAADAIRFDGNQIVFLPTGGVTPLEDPSTAPLRGIYFADWEGKNYFRVTVESDLSGKARVDKYLGSGYVESEWQWQ
jgi:Tfp pilus assembly protein FimT